ncbi:MAG: hypothetical protein ACE5DX_05210 [Candidatus Dojkabacteria bacterium]
MKTKGEIIFVYNADSGVVNGAIDYAHKIISPSTYQCSLCALSYGNLGMKRKWRRFVKDLPYKVTLLHKDEYAERFSDHKIDYPAMLLLDLQSKTLEVLISSGKMDKQKNLEELMKLVKEITDDLTDK